MAIQHIHKALRHLTANDDKEGNSSHLDQAVTVLTKSKDKGAVKAALQHIKRHDDLEGNSPLVDQAADALRKAGK